MEPEPQPLQQPVRKVVGRRRTASETLGAIEDLAQFIKKVTHGTPVRAEGDYFPVRKVVGRPRESSE